MLRKNQRRSSLTSWQVQQLKPIIRSLRELNRDALRELRRIKYTGLTRSQYREAGDLYGTIATRMISALRFLHEILKAEEPQQQFWLNVRFVTPCIHNVHRPESEQLAGCDDEARREALKLLPAHQADIASLLELTNSIEERVSRRPILRGAPLNKFFRGINRLRLAVLQQQQDLLATAPEHMAFELHLAFGADVCPDCPQIEEMEGATDRSEESFTERSLLDTEERGCHEKR